MIRLRNIESSKILHCGMDTAFFSAFFLERSMQISAIFHGSESVEHSTGDGGGQRYNCGQPCGLQKKTVKHSGLIHNTGNKKIPYGGKLFSHTGSGKQRPCSGGDKTKMVFSAKGGVDSDKET